LPTQKAKTETKIQTRQPGAKVNEKPLKILNLKNIYRETLSDASKLGRTCFKEQNLCRLPNSGKTRKQLSRTELQNVKEHVYTAKSEKPKNVFSPPD
jgi:hypothetical protein